MALHCIFHLYQFGKLSSEQVRAGRGGGALRLQQTSIVELVCAFSAEQRSFLKICVLSNDGRIAPALKLFEHDCDEDEVCWGCCLGCVIKYIESLSIFGSARVNELRHVVVLGVVYVVVL
jgi:hypothetical protein